MKRIPIVVALALGACNRDAPPAPSADQSARLDEAEEMLNDLGTNEEGPEANAPDPSVNSD